MINLKSNNIKDFPFEQYADLNDSQVEDLAKTHFLTAHNSWMLPQIAAHYGSWHLVWQDNKVDANATARKNVTTPHDIGLWKVSTKLKRGSLVKSQINPEFASYSALVPLILMGAKKFQGVKYSQWDIDATTKLVDENLRDAMFWKPDESTLGFIDLSDCEPQCGLGSNRLLELRAQGLTVKSGVKKGATQNPTSSWCLRGMQGTELGKAPKLVGTMLTQIWVAHPSLRTEYMILDPHHWDLMPAPLVAESIFTPKTDSKEKSVVEMDLPWNT